jgi:hypothetical protein
MRRARLALSILALLLSFAVAGIALLAPAPPRINVRWAERATTSDRVREASQLHLDAPEPNGERTWSYQLLDHSTANIASIVAHPLIDDTHNLDRAGLTLSPESPPIRSRLRQLYRQKPLDALSSWWMATSLGLLAVGLALAWPAVRVSHAADPSRLPLVAILLLSAILRVVLALSGGQFYWPDEGRYQAARDGVVAVAAHDGIGLAKAFDDFAHVLFKMVAMIPAAIEFVRGDDSRIPAIVFALFSVLNVWLVVEIARRLDAGATAAVIAGGVFALSVSFFYYSRHLLPYDVAATFGLLALRAGAARPASWRHSCACGMWAACAFLAYAGYWTLGGAACVVHVCDVSRLRDGARRGALAVAGLALTLSTAFLVCMLLDARALDKLTAFAQQVTQGNYQEGWRLPWEYLWHAEHFLLVLWFAALAWCIVEWRTCLRTRVLRAGIVGLGFTYGTLVLCSVGFNLFVVYGRLARQMVPFFCLIAGTMVIRTLDAVPPRRRKAVLLMTGMAVAVQVAYNYAPPLRQQFPREFIPRAEAISARTGAPEPMLGYAHHIYPSPEELDIPPDAVVVYRTAHPLQFLPYQYEGFTREERERLRSTDIRMLAAVRNPVPGALPRPD